LTILLSGLLVLFPLAYWAFNLLDPLHPGRHHPQLVESILFTIRAALLSPPAELAPRAGWGSFMVAFEQLIAFFVLGLSLSRVSRRFV
jgi:hypothetical protein